MVKEASYGCATFKVSELFSTTANVFLWTLHGYVLGFMHLLAKAIAESPEFMAI